MWAGSYYVWHYSSTTTKVQFLESRGCTPCERSMKSGICGVSALMFLGRRHILAGLKCTNTILSSLKTRRFGAHKNCVYKHQFEPHGDLKCSQNKDKEHNNRLSCLQVLSTFRSSDKAVNTLWDHAWVHNSELCHNFMTWPQHLRRTQEQCNGYRGHCGDCKCLSAPRTVVLNTVRPSPRPTAL